MSSKLTDVMHALSLPDDDFFALDAAALSALQAKVAKLVVPPLGDGPPATTYAPLPELRAASAPAAVDWRRRSGLPLVIAEVRSNRREWEVHRAQNQWLLVSNVDTGDVGVVQPIGKGRRMPQLPPSRSGDLPDAINAATSSVGVSSYEVSTWFTREQLRGRLAITYFEHDLAANTCLVEGTGEGAQPAKGAALGGRRIATRVPGAVPTAGVSFGVPEVLGAGARLTAQVRLPRARVTALDAVPAPGEGLEAPLLLGATVVMVQLDQSVPVLLPLAAPAAADPGGDVESGFGVDLTAALAGREMHGEWLAYLVVGDTVTGPKSFRIATR